MPGSPDASEGAAEHPLVMLFPHCDSCVTWRSQGDKSHPRRALGMGESEGLRCGSADQTWNLTLEVPFKVWLVSHIFTGVITSLIDALANSGTCEMQDIER